MLRVSRLVILVSILGLSFAAIQPEAFAAQRQKVRPTRKAKKAPPAPPAPVIPSGPLTPLTLQQTPALPAQIDFQNGQLTITARNSSLGDILRTVHTKTGATMDFPPNVSERVVGQFGPGQPRDVLASLLNGANFNYAIVGSPANPTGMDKVIITRNTGGPTPPGQGAVAGIRPQIPPAEDQTDDAEVDNQGAPSEEMVPADEGDQTSAGSGQPDNPQGERIIKTPEQLLQELQRQQQMQQQQMQQQQGAPQGLPTPQQQRPDN